MRLGEAARLAKGENWYLSRYHDYLRNRQVDREGDVLKSIVDRPLRIREGGFSASSAGTCPRRQQFIYLGLKPKPFDQKIDNVLANGEYVHLRHQVFGLVAGYIEEVEVPVSIPDWNLRGTMDGVLCNGEGLEIKSINTHGYSGINTYGPKDPHLNQVNTYMWATGMKAFRIIYEDKGTNLTKEFKVERDEKIIDGIKRRTEQLLKATERNELIEMQSACVDPNSSEFRNCQFNHICEAQKWPSESRRVIRVTSSTADA